MRELLPDFVRETIRDRYLAGIADAEAKFKYHEADEDSLTGALGQAISTRQSSVLQIGTQTFIWEIYSRKIGGRGRGAPEKLIGADGIFQIEISDENGRLLRRKGLLFQAKKRWSGADGDLLKQAQTMLSVAGDGIAIDYTEHGYTSCRAVDVVEAGGNKKVAIARQAVQPLGQILANDFLDCSIGSHDLFFEPKAKKLQYAWSDRSPPMHLITTEVTKYSTFTPGTGRL